MAQVIKLTVSGAGYACAKVPSVGGAQIVGIVAKPDASVALSVTLYSSPTYSTSAIPAGSEEIAGFSAAAGGQSPILDLSPDGIGVNDFLIAQFTDTGTAHVLYVYIK
jgi:hypothetical protein